jgi:hypothetical protein
MECDPPGYVAFSVIAKDPEGVISVNVQAYTKDNVLIAQIDLASQRDIYFGSGPLVGDYTVYDIDYYKFSAIDGLKNTSNSQPYRDRSGSCNPIPTPTATPTSVPLGLYEGSRNAQ